MKVEHLVVAVAGLGKRLRPLTLRRPKALVRVGGIPLLEYILEEARGTNITTVTLIVSPQHKGQFEKYLKHGKKLFPEFTFHIKVQRKPLGNGHAILQAASVVKEKPFAVRFPDDLLFDTEPILHSMLSIFESSSPAPLVLLQRVPKRDVSKYGVVAVTGKKRVKKGNLYRITRVVEKPPMNEAPSNLTAVGGYIFTPNVMHNLKRLADALPHHENDVLPWTAGFEPILSRKGMVRGWEFPGVRLDCGSLSGFQEAEKFLQGRRK